MSICQISKQGHCYVSKMHVTGKGMGILNQELLPKGNNSYNPKLLWYAILTSHILLLIITWCLSSDETVLYYFNAINYDY